MTDEPTTSDRDIHPAAAASPPIDAATDVTLPGDTAGAAAGRATPPPDLGSLTASRVLGAGIELPATWGRFALVEPLGRGGMGRVFRAWDPVLERHVALKVLVGDDPVQFERFQREARIQASVDHPAVCKVYEVGDVDGVPYIAMQLVRGRTLDRASETLSIDQRVALVRQAAEGVHAAHRAGLIHRDLKPANVLVEELEGGRRLPYVVDFGLARVLDEPGLTQTWQVAGTPSFMAPEQAAGHTAAADRRTDVYGLGATLYDVLTGRPPASGASVVEVMLQVVNQDPVPPRAINPEIPRDLETIVLRCLDKEPSRRYESAHAVAEELGRFLDGEPILGQRSSVLYRVAKKARKHRVAVGAVGVAVLAVLAGAGVALRARWTATEQARLAQELGREVMEIEAVVRHSQMLPPHDVTADEAAVRERMARLAARLPGLGRAAVGPGNYALGRGYLALDDVDRAQGLLDRAWATGYRTPEVAHARSIVLGRLYQRQLSEASRIPSRALRQQRLAEIDVRLRQPIMELLQVSRGSQSVAPELVEATLAFYEKRWDVALAKCTAALAREPWLWEAPMLVSKVQGERSEEARLEGRWDDALALRTEADAALEQARTIARSAPMVLDAMCGSHGWRLAILREAGREVEPAFPDAEAACQAAIAVRPASPNGYRSLAYVTWQVVEERIARGVDAQPLIASQIDLARRAVELDPKSATAHSDLGMAYERLGEHQRRRGEDPRDAYARAIKCLEQSVAIEPTGLYPLNNLGLVHLQQGGWERAHGIDPTSRLEAAIARFQTASEADSKVALPLVNMGSALVDLAVWENDHGRDPRLHLTRAVEALRRAVEINPNDRRPHNNIAWALMISADYSMARGGNPEQHLREATESLRKAIAISPSYSLAHNNLGEILWRLGERRLAQGQDPQPVAREALAAFEEAARLNPTWSEPLWGLGNTHKTLAAHALLRRADIRAVAARALAYLGKATRLQPDLAGAYLTSGRVHLLLARERLARSEPTTGPLAAAEASLRRALELNPQFHDAASDLGECAVLRARVALAGQVDPGPALTAAEGWFRKALALNPDHADALLGLAKAARRRAEWILVTGGDPASQVAAGLDSQAAARAINPALPEIEAEAGALHLAAARAVSGAPRAEAASRAAAILRQALEHNPLLGLDYADLKRQAEALVAASAPPS